MPSILHSASWLKNSAQRPGPIQLIKGPAYACRRSSSCFSTTEAARAKLAAVVRARPTTSQPGSQRRTKTMPGKTLNEREQAELKEAFDLFDHEKSGKLNIHELKVLMRALGFQVKKRDVVKCIHDIEPQNEGHVDFSLYAQIMAEKYALRDPEEEILKAFQLFDHDGSGKISLKNMRHVAAELGEDLADEELQAMIEEFDRDQDGEISQEEFLTIMRSA